jgi:hypothetical protein
MLHTVGMDSAGHEAVRLRLPRRYNLPVPKPTYDELAAAVQTYEEALTRIAGKPGEYARLKASGVPFNDDAESAYKKCARIATTALWQHHPETRPEHLAAQA